MNRKFYFALPVLLAAFAFPSVGNCQVNLGADPVSYLSPLGQRPTTEEHGWYLPGFGYLPPWPHTLPRHTSSERYMGYLTPSGLYSPFLDALDAGTIRWVYPPRRHGQTARKPGVYSPTPVAMTAGSGPAIIATVIPEDVAATAPELSGRDAASLRAEGASQLKGNRLARSLSLLTAATERDAEDAAAWYLRAVAERELGKTEQATESARRGQALEMLGRTDSAQIAKALENVQGPSRRFLLETTGKLSLADARVILANPAASGLAGRTK